LFLVLGVLAVFTNEKLLIFEQIESLFFVNDSSNKREDIHNHGNHHKKALKVKIASVSKSDLWSDSELSESDIDEKDKTDIDVF